ncbi:MAG: S4 domain-containing protein, partial [Terriglobales bacterium]
MPQVPPKNRPPLQKVRKVAITANETGQRLDNFLLKILSGVPRSAVYRIIRSGEVRVN